MEQNHVENRGVLIAIGGLPGAGKATLADSLYHILAKQGDAVWLKPGPMFYDDFVRDISHALKQGKTVIAEAVFGIPSARNGIEAVAQSNNARFSGLWLHAPADVLAARVQEYPNDIQSQFRQQSNFITDNEWYKVDTSGHEGAALGQAVNHLIREKLIDSPVRPAPQPHSNSFLRV